MQKSHIFLIVVLALTAAVFAWNLWLRPSPPLEVTLLADRSGTLTFVFNDALRFEEVRVFQNVGTDDGGEDGGMTEEVTLWHMVPRDNPPENVRPVSAVVYGEPRGLGLRPSPGIPARGTPLKRGVAYTLEARSDGGDVTFVFTLP